jgi:general secretion pathway protein G
MSRRLIAILVVSGIVIGVPATLVIWRYILVSSVTTCRSRIENDLEALAIGLLEFRTRTGVYPESLSELLSGTPDGSWKWPVPRLPNDPWGRNYLYVRPIPDDESVGLLLSLGRDNRPGGRGEDMDVIRALE